MASIPKLTPSRLRSFMRSVEKRAGADGCWLWRGAVAPNGYPAFVKGVPAHRVAYVWMVGDIEAGFDVDHLCRNRACVNPHHLEPVTKSENCRRRAEYGPFQIRRYCRRGHALNLKTAWVSRGKWFCRECKRARKLLRDDETVTVRTVIEFNQKVG